jgi:adenylate kinase
VIILMGVIGAGKSMQGKLFAEEQGYTWVSTGELFRALLTGERSKELTSGRLVNDEETIKLVNETFEKLDLSKEFVLEGFPRTNSQVEWLMSKVGQNGLKLTAIFNLTLSKEVVVNRLLTRGRSDDSEDVIVERFKEYETKTLPIISLFKQAGITIYDIDADRDPNTVHDSMLKYLNTN